MIPLSESGRLKRQSTVLSAVAVTMLGIVGCGSRPASVAVGRVPATVSAAAVLPSGNNPITELVGNPKGTGVWFWDETSSQVSIFYVGAHSRLKSWPILSGSSYLRPQSRSGLAVSDDGLVWFGINTILVELNPATGKVMKWSIPAPRRNPDADRYLPPDLKRVSAVQGISVSPSGQVAIAMTNSSSLAVFDPASGEFTKISMPAREDEPLAVAYASDGVLAVALANFATHQAHQAVTVTTSGRTVMAAVPDSTQITADQSGGFIVGSWRPTLLAANGLVTALVTPSGALGTTGEPQPPGRLPSNRIAFVTTSGIEEFPAKTASTPAAMSREAAMLTVPHVRCVPVHPPPVQGGVMSGSTPSCVRPTVQVMATDGSGNVWIVAPDRPGTVEMLTP